MEINYYRFMQTILIWNIKYFYLCHSCENFNVKKRKIQNAKLISLINLSVPVFMFVAPLLLVTIVSIVFWFLILLNLYPTIPIIPRLIITFSIGLALMLPMAGFLSIFTLNTLFLLTLCTFILNALRVYLFGSFRLSKCICPEPILLQFSNFICFLYTFSGDITPWKETLRQCWLSIFVFFLTCAAFMQCVVAHT